MTIALASDHAGFEQLKQLQDFLESIGHQCHNFGPVSLRPDDDYPDFVFVAAKAVASGGYERGIILGRSGQGEAMAANRIKGVRCVVFYGPAVARRVVDAHGKTSHDPYEIIKLSRQHNNSNMLSLAASFVSPEDIKNIVKLWLETPFSGEERHQRRINKLDEAM
ncbi:MAG: RpiB/LacA/LacB family sugar-phosphate isomerase [bacterium]|nr:RpiB/LacA/LacB family sugar-phosphate isomerase [bacterium]